MKQNAPGAARRTGGRKGERSVLQKLAAAFFSLAAEGAAGRDYRMVTLVPRGVCSKNVLAMSAGRRTQPWLTGYPVTKPTCMP